MDGIETVDINTVRTYPRSMSLQSTVGVAKVGTKSLRSTVPEGVVAYLDIQEGDKLDWRMEIEDGEKVVKVRKSMTDAQKVATKYLTKKGS